jgi:hypothetical protein
MLKDDGTSFTVTMKDDDTGQLANDKQGTYKYEVKAIARGSLSATVIGKKEILLVCLADI